MFSLSGLSARIGLCIALVVFAVPVLAAPFAAYVMDARTGETLYAKNAETPLHPASLTKMLTLYIAFEAIERGEITLDTKITISQHAASQPPSRLGLRAGQRIALRHLIRAAALKSANDAATAIAEGISGSEPAFAKRMNRTAKALGMTRSTFRNANGLTAPGHLSTAKDMSVLGRRLFYDFPQYYGIFSRRTADAGIAEVANTNRRFLDSYPGADGIKTGYTVAAGFNLTASAERGGKRIIATIFGGTSTANRNARMAELMDIGFGKAPREAPVNVPEPPVYAALDGEAAPATAVDVETAGGAGKTIRLVTTLARSPRPRPRPTAEELAIASAAAATAASVPTAAAAPPAPAPADPAAAAEAAVLAMADVIEGAVAQANAPMPFAAEGETPADAGPGAAEAAPEGPGDPAESVSAVALAAAPAPVRPRARPAAPVTDAGAPPSGPSAGAEPVALAAAAPPDESPAGTGEPVALAAAPAAPAGAIPFEVIDAPQAGVPGALPFALVDPSDLPPEPGTPAVQEAGMLAFLAPAPRPAPPVSAAEADAEVAILRPAPPPDAAPVVSAEPEVVTRVSTSGGRHWGVSLGLFAEQSAAERILMKTMLSENASLGDGLRKVVRREGKFDATILGLSEDQASLACRRLRARAMTCETIGP